MGLCYSNKRKVRILNAYEINTSVALKNILIRKKERNTSMKSKKNIKSALVVQGGGMRGVFSAGSLIALEKMGFSQGFDAVYGSSGGAMNAAYFLTKQCPFGASIYYEDINNSKFINIFRINRILDIDYLIDKVIRHKKPLDLHKLNNSQTPMYLFVTEANTGKTIRFDSKSKNILKLLKATCAVPILCNKTVSLNNRTYLDGAISKSIPIEEAIKDGCTDILVLLTHSVKFRKSISFSNLFEKILVKKFLSKFSKKLVDTYLTGLKNYEQAFDISLGVRKVKENIHIATIVPDDNFRVTRLTKDQILLKQAAIDGAKKVFDLFNKNYNMNDILKYN